MATVKLPDGRTITFPDGLAPEQVRKIVDAASGKAEQADFGNRVAGMTHEQKVEAYRATKPGDPWGDFLAGEIQKPRQGETPEQAKTRAYGTGSTARVDMSPTGKAAATFLQGVPFAGEYADEGLGYVAGKMGLQSQDDATEAIRAAQADMDQEAPKTATALRIGGGVAGGVALGGASPWWTPQSLGGQVLYGGTVGAGVGALEGGISGYGSGTTPESRKNNAQSRALISGLVGGAVGAAAPLVARGAEYLWRRGQDYLTIGREAREVGMDRPAYEHVIRALEADDAFSPQGQQRLAAGGQEAMLADAGPSTNTLLDAAQQTTGPGSGLSRGRIEGRASRAGLQANDALDNAFGVPRGMDSMETAIRQGSAPARQAAYDAAYAVPVNYADPAGQQLEQMLQRVPGDIINKANRLMQIEGQQSAQIMAQIAPDGSVTYTRMPDVRQLDYITRAINLAAESGDGAGALGGQTALGRAYQNLSRDIRQTVRGLVPEYGAALDTAAEPIAARQALQFGETMLKPSTSRDEVANMLSGMSQAESQQVAAGIRATIDEKLANVTMALTDTNMDAREAIKAVKDLSSRASREKITALLGQQQADAFFAQFDQAARGLELRANLAQNSRTAVRTRAQREIDDAVNSGVVNSVRQGEPVNLAKSVWQRMFGGTPGDRIARSDRVWEQIADALTAPMPQNRLTALNTIAQVAPRNASMAQVIGGLAGYGFAGPAGYQAGVQLMTPRQRQQLGNALENR